jgi:hypothetical protein
MNKVLFADNAGRQFQKVYGQSHIALAGLVPVGLLTDGHSFPGKAADFGLAFALPVHSHIGLNFGTPIISFHTPPFTKGFTHLHLSFPDSRPHLPYPSLPFLLTVVADYVPKMLQVPARVGVLGMSTIMFLGLMKLNIMGPGLCSSIKQLWQKEVEQ